MRLRRWSGAVAVVCAAALLNGCEATAGKPPAAVTVSATCSTAQVVRTWPLSRLARQTIVVPVDENHVADVSAQVAGGVGGVILFGSSAPSSLGRDLARLARQARGGIRPLVMTDEEGGSVQRMANLVGSMPSARDMAQTMTTRQVRRLAERVASRMRDANVTMNLAPVLDLDDRPGPSATNPDGTRSFSIDPAVASAYGLAFARGMRAGGVVPVVKHFPGLGHATRNTDVGPAWTVRWSVLRHQGLVPFRAAVQAGLPAVMVSNARVPGLTGLPASLSWRATHVVLRDRLGFHGLVVTDSLSAGAISGAGYSVRRAAVRSLVVGADLVLFNATPDQVPAVTHRITRAVVGAVRDGRLPLPRLRHAVVHVLRAKHASVCG